MAERRKALRHFVWSEMGRREFRSIEGLADNAGIEYEALYAYLSGNGVPSLVSVYRLARALRVPLDDIAGFFIQEFEPNDLEPPL